MPCRSTTVIAFRPEMVDRPFSCNLNNAEVFSCILGKEDESALSIIDPVTINVEVGGRGSTGFGGVGVATRGLADAASEEHVERTVEIQLQQLNIRLSYHDWLMFRVILDSFPRQAREALYGRDQREQDERMDVDKEPTNVVSQVQQLESLGFSREDCSSALKECDGSLDDAALWLTTNATPKAPERKKKQTKKKGKIVPRSRTTSLQAANMEVEAEQEDEDEEDKLLDEVSTVVSQEDLATVDEGFLQGTPVSFSHVELKTSSVNLCVIDDCKDADVPLLEVAMSHLHLKHSFGGSGDACATMSGSYYNRALSSWEPFMEPWRQVLLRIHPMISYIIHYYF